MAVRTRGDVFPVETRIDTTQIVPASKLVSQVTGYTVQPNKAIVGANAFAHESGIHQDGVLKHRETYEIMRAEDVGWGANKLVLGKHSGRNAFRARLQDLGIEIGSEDHLNVAFARFKELADKKHEIFDEDLNALMRDESVTPETEHFRLVASRFHSETGETPQAEITLTIDGRTISSVFYLVDFWQKRHSTWQIVARCTCRRAASAPSSASPTSRCSCRSRSSSHRSR